MRGGKFDPDRARALVAEAKIADAATPGVWEWRKWSGDEEGSYMSLASDALTNDDVIGASGMHTEGYIYLSEADAAFIAAARTLVPALADALEAACTAIESPREATLDERKHRIKAVDAYIEQYCPGKPTDTIGDTIQAAGPLMLAWNHGYHTARDYFTDSESFSVAREAVKR